MNTPGYRNLGISTYIDIGRTTTTERILAITGQIYTREKEKIDWKSAENHTPTQTVGQQFASRLILELLK